MTDNTQPQPFEIGHCARCSGINPPTDHSRQDANMVDTQDIDELKRLYRCIVYDFHDGKDREDMWVREVGSVVNKRIEAVLDRLLEHGEDFTTFGDGSRSVAVEHIEAERAKLKKN